MTPKGMTFLALTAKVLTVLVATHLRINNMINLTPHAITLRTPAGDVTFPPSGQLARVSTIATPTGETVAGVPVVRNTYGPVTGLVRDANGVPLPCIVSGMVLAALPAGTINVYAPATGATAIRKDGQVIAVTELVAA
jgi:hypothetical protein